MPQPIVPPPSTDTGALTLPRTLQRWLDVNRMTRLERTSSYITFPAFSQAVSWKGYSEIVTAFNYEGPNNFSLVSGFGLPTLLPNYMLCIMWEDDSFVTHRYAIWKDVGEVLYFDVPLYTGQVIKKNFRFEVWSINDTPAVQATDITLYTSVKGKIDYRYGTDFILVSSDTKVTDFQDYGNPTTTLSSTDLVLRWDSIIGRLFYLPTEISAWTDIVAGIDLTTFGEVFIAATTDGYTTVETFGAAYNNTMNVNVSCAIFTLKLPLQTGYVFDFAGDKVVMDWNHSTKKLRTNSSPGIVLTTGVWYIVAVSYLTSLSLKISVYNGVTGVLEGTETIVASYDPTTKMFFGDCFELHTTDIIMYYNAAYNVDITNGVAYLLSKLNRYALPLTFPTNSVPQPN